MKFAIRVWKNGVIEGYVRSVSSAGVVAVTKELRLAKKCKTDWEAQTTVDSATMNALYKGYVLEIMPVNSR